MSCSNSNNSTQYRVVVRYIYDLPYKKRNQLCNILDVDSHWKNLGGEFMKLDRPELDMIGKAVLRKESPSNELLNLMESRNYTITRLFKWLFYMKHYQAMEILRPFVEPENHHLLPGTHSEIVPSESENASLIDPNKKNEQGRFKINEKTTQRKISGADVEKSANLPIPYIEFKELEEGTNFWHKDQKLGQGGFGVVFKGVWGQNEVAIKRLKPREKKNGESNTLGFSLQQAYKELNFLNMCRIDNILPLYGYSLHDREYILVYQYMPNGSLEDCLHRPRSAYLSWTAKHKIAGGTARGLQFLHTRNPPLIHGDIKSANILLDKHYEPKIGDFGLAREGPKGLYTLVSHVYGTRPYLPHEFLRSKKFSKEVDTYSFGVVLFEIATGQKAYDDGRPEKYLRDYVYNYNEDFIYNLADRKSDCEYQRYKSLFVLFINLGKQCVRDCARDRPEMINVFKSINSLEIDESRLRTNTDNPYQPTRGQIPNDFNVIDGLVIAPNARSNSTHSLIPGVSPDPRSLSPTILTLPRNELPLIQLRNQVAEVSSCVGKQLDREIGSGYKASDIEEHSFPIPDIKFIPPTESKKYESVGISSPVPNQISDSDESSEFNDSDDDSHQSDQPTSVCESTDDINNEQSEYDQLPNLSIFNH